MSNSRFLQVSILMIFFVMSVFPVQAQAPEDWKKDARQIWMKGFDYYEKGEKSRKNGQLRESLTLFKESLRHFEKIKSKYPKWNTALINYRLKVCRTKMETLKIAFEKQNIKFTETATDKKNLLLRSRLATTEKELQDTKNQLDTTYASLEAARREAARNVKTSTHVELLMKEKVELTNRCALLENRNKQLKAETEKKPAKIAEETSLDKALLQIETLKKVKGQLISMLETEKQKYVILSGNKNDMAYQLKMIQKTGKVIVKNKDAVDKRVVVLEESVHQVKKEKEELALTLQETVEKLKISDASIAKLRNDVKQARSESNIDADAIATQLGNDNELMLKSLETANIKLMQKNKQTKELKEENNASKNKIALLEKTLASIDENSEQVLSDLKMLNKKIFISDTITRKQDQTIIEQKEEYETLKKDFDYISRQHKNMTDKEDEFTRLAQQSIALEGKNQKLQEDIQKVEKANKQLILSSKQQEMDIIKSQNHYKSIVNQLAKIEQENLRLKIDRSQENQLLIEKCRILTNSLNKITKSSEEYDKKVELLTDELVSVNTALASKERVLAELQKSRQLTTVPEVEGAVSVTPEPQIISETPEYLALKREKDLLLTKLAKNENVLPGKFVEISKPEVDKAEVKKLLDSAISAEKSGKNEAAIWYYEKLLLLEPENPPALAGIGIIEATNGNYKKALPLLTKAIVYDSDNVDVLQALTFCYIGQKEYYLALGAVSRASAKATKDPTLQRYMGIICSNLGWNKAAEHQFRNSFKLDPTSSETAYNAAVHIATTAPERKSEAKIWYERAIQLGAQRDPVLEKLFK